MRWNFNKLVTKGRGNWCFIGGQVVGGGHSLLVVCKCCLSQYVHVCTCTCTAHGHTCTQINCCHVYMYNVLRCVSYMYMYNYVRLTDQ